MLWCLTSHKINGAHGKDGNWMFWLVRSQGVGVLIVKDPPNYLVWSKGMMHDTFARMGYTRLTQTESKTRSDQLYPWSVR